MQKIIKYFLIIFILFNVKVFAKENFFHEAKVLFEEGKIEESKFLFQRNIVFNPKDSKSYLYLAKIFESEKNEIEEEKNINTTLLLDPENEEAMYMLIDIKLEKSDIKKIIITDTISIPKHKLIDKLKIMSVSGIFGQAVDRVHNGESVSALFEYQKGEE